MEIAIIGGGLAGLACAYRLEHQPRDVHIQLIEARDRLGGRALTVDAEGCLACPEDLASGWFDLGGSWFWSDQTRLPELLDELGIEIFDQHEEGKALEDRGPGQAPNAFDLPAKERTTRRFVGGGARLCHHLARHLTPDQIHLSTRATAIEIHGDGVRIHLRDLDTNIHNGTDTNTERTVRADRAILTLPPQLLRDEIRFEPALPAELIDALARAPTWMGHAMKCVVLYPAPFWRQRGLSGIVKSPHGPVQAFHDASTHDPADGSFHRAALFGFFTPDPAVRRLPLAERRDRVLAQLERCFGPEAGAPLAYFEHDWSTDRLTSHPDHQTIEADPRYREEAFTRPWMAGRLIFAGAETVEVGGGYLEGAVRSADRAVELALRSASS